MKRIVAPVLALALACSSEAQQPVVQYPSDDASFVSEETASESATEVLVQDQLAPDVDAAAALETGTDSTTPLEPVQLSKGACSLEGATSDRHLVFAQDADMMVWPEGANEPVLVYKDYQYGYDMRAVRGRFFGLWTGADVLDQTLLLWSKAGGVETIASKALGTRLYARAQSEEYAYWVRGSGALWVDVYASKAGQGKGTKVLTDLDTGVVEEACQPWIVFSDQDLLVAGCPNSASQPRVAGYALDGSGQTRLLLSNSWPGLWLDHKRARALLQTATTASLHSLVEASPPVEIDGMILEARFSADDSALVYRDKNETVKRANTQAPASPEAFGKAIALLGMSADGRYVVVATTGQVDDKSTDLVLLDTLTPAGLPVKLAQEKAALVGFSDSGDQVVYQATPQYPILGADELFVASTAGGSPTKVSDRADRIVFDGSVVYWFEFDAQTKTAGLKAARLSALGTVQEVASGLDALTAHAKVVGKHLFVASKLGLWDYPALSP